MGNRISRGGEKEGGQDHPIPTAQNGLAQSQRIDRDAKRVGALGMAVGIFLALLVTHALSSQGIVFAVPWMQLFYFVIAAIVVGILAAIFPARRAARLNVLEALQYE